MASVIEWSLRCEMRWSETIQVPGIGLSLLGFYWDLIVDCGMRYRED